MMKRKAYIPKQRHNREYQAARIDKLEKEVEDHRRVLEMVTQSYEQHMEHLSAFAKHDMGNAVQSMYAALKILSKKLSSDDYLGLKTSVDNVDNTLKNFENLVPYTRTGEFVLSKLMNALEVMTRFYATADNIDCIFVYARAEEIKINQPYQAILQLLQNLIINSLKALKNVEGEKRLVIEATNDADNCIIMVKDTGCGIEDEYVERVFEYKFTTTDGCGIGLYHAKYVCEKINGAIGLQRNIDNFSTVFTLKFPLNGTKEDIGN